MTLRAGARDVVLLHGWGLTAGIWEDLAARLAPRFRVHVPDLPGHGATPAREPYTLEAMADAVARAAPRRCHVAGWSLGGQVALVWARRAARQVERLALIATTPCFARRADWTGAVPTAVLREFAHALTADYAGTLRRFAMLQALGDARARQVVTVLKRYLPRRSASAVRALGDGLTILLDTDLRGTLAAVTQPVLVLHGARDRLAPATAGRRLAAVLPDARFILMRGCAHAPFLSQPARVAQALREFFDE